MKKKGKKFVFCLISIFALLLVVNPSLAYEKNLDVDSGESGGNQWLEAIGVEDGAIVPKNCRGTGEKNNGNECGIEDMIQVAINIAAIIVGLSGSILLLMFTYGGIMFILAAGNQERVQKAKQILTTAVIGLVIILGAWVMINFIINALTGGETGGPGFIFGGRRSWYELPESN